jgi:hypothetical protein
MSPFWVSVLTPHPVGKCGSLLTETPVVGYMHFSDGDIRQVSIANRRYTNPPRLRNSRER